jgi:hypothetical protein
MLSSHDEAINLNAGGKWLQTENKKGYNMYHIRSQTKQYGNNLSLQCCIVLYLFQIPTDPCTGKRISHKTTGYRKCHNYSM